MYDKQTKTQKRLIKEFPEINDDTAEDIDIKIKTKVLILIEMSQRSYRKR